MSPTDKQDFFKLLEGVYDFYAKELSKWALEVWWNAMKIYDLEAIRDAFGRHCVNPDSGQWLPKPADVVKMLSGSTLDAAMLAWSKLEKAVKEIGPHQTVVFDDPIIHRVAQDMGGWIQFGMITEKEWPFTQKEFENRYRGYRGRSAIPDYPESLIGINDAYNGAKGYALGEVKYIGNFERKKLTA